MPDTPIFDTGPVDPGSPFASIEAELVEGYPSVVRVTWSQRTDAKVHLEYTFEADHWMSSPERVLDVGPHEELLLGVPFDQTVTYRLVTEKGALSKDRTVATGVLPSIIPESTVLTYDSSGVDAESPYVLVGVSETGSLVRTWILLIDRQGRVLWAHRTPQGRNSMHPRKSRNGNSFLIDHSSYFANLASQGQDSQVLEMKIDGTVVRTWDTPGQHHPFVDLPDGSLAYARYIFEGLGDDRIEIVRPSGQLETLFSCRDWLADVGLPPFECGSNTMNYDAARDVYLYSIFRFDTIFEVNGTTGEVGRVFGFLGQSPYPETGGYNPWAFSPPDSAFDYQHNPTYTNTGTLLVSSHVSEYSNELVVREYELTQENTLREVWNFGVGEGVEGCQMGEAHRLPGGNTLHNYGTHAVLREATPEREVVWDIRWEDQEYSCFGGSNTPGHRVMRSEPVGPDLYRFAPVRR